MTSKRMNNASDIWRLPDKAFGLMGILNITPDSFYDGGKFNNLDASIRRAEKLLAEGADIIDIGAESTRPDSRPIGASEEKNRLLAPFDAIRRQFPQAVISLDAWRSETAQFFIKRGANIINDISGLVDRDMPAVLAEFRPGYVLTFNLSHFEAYAPTSANVIEMAKTWFAAALARLVRAGLPEENIALDPGIGFGKNLAQNLALLKNLGEFLEFGRPILVGISMKSWLGNLLDLPISERSRATATASALLWQKGAFWHRIHEVKFAREALELACALT